MDAQTIGFLELLDGKRQYVVPLWQRRYCWGKDEIEELIKDLLAVAQNDGVKRRHYGGTMLTFSKQDDEPAGVVNTKRVVDGQQRLTTVSILLACIAEKLGPDGNCGSWTANEIRTGRLFNLVNDQPHPKLLLQGDDAIEYRNILNQAPKGPGAVTQAWRIISNSVAKHDECSLIEGLRKLRVVSIGLGHHDDPQQIFESLNATGRPLTESEKVKNWLLIGLEDSKQRELHNNYWVPIERALNAQYGNTKPVDEFLRDLLRWWTGELVGEKKSFSLLRRWAGSNGRTSNPALLKEISELATLYGLLTNTGTRHPDARVERELRHLRAVGIDVHRPLSLRLLHDSGGFAAGPEATEALAKSLHGIGAWLTRLWLAGRIPAGMNKEMLILANDKGPGQDDDSADYWLAQISKRRNNQWAVPNDAEIRHGIRTRSAYGGSATKSATAILYAMMNDKHAEESPPPDRLTLEHVMPQRLTDEWRRELGPNAHEIHGRWKNSLPNLVLMGDTKNARLGQQVFQKKRAAYLGSSMGLTRQVGEFSSWGESDLIERAKQLAEEALRIWPWEESGQATRKFTSEFATRYRWRWRIGDGEWHGEAGNKNQIVMNVARALLERHSDSLGKLVDELPNRGIVHVSKAPTDRSKEPWKGAKNVPGFEEYLLNPWRGRRRLSDFRGLCKELCKRCNETVDVEVHPADPHGRFWKYLKQRGDVPGIPDEEAGDFIWTNALNRQGDCIVIKLELKSLFLFIGVMLWGEHSMPRDGRSARVGLYSSEICRNMGDQVQHDSTNPNYSFGVQYDWELEDDAGWDDAATWISDQYKRLEDIVRRNSD